MTTFLSYFIPGRADHARIIKRAIIYKEAKPAEDKRRKRHGSGQRPSTESVTGVEIGSSGSKVEGYTGNGVKVEGNRIEVRGCDASFRLSAGQEGVGEEREVEDTVQGEGQAETIEKSKWKKVVLGFEWGSDQQQSLEHIKHSIITNAVYGRDEREQYHLSTDALRSGLGGVPFQLIKQPPRTIASPRNRNTSELLCLYRNLLLRQRAAIQPLKDRQ